jgi:hypothetical protein
MCLFQNNIFYISLRVNARKYETLEFSLEVEYKVISHQNVKNRNSDGFTAR